MLDRKLMENALKGYTVALVDVKPSQIIQAFSRTLEELKFMPVPAVLQDMAVMTMTTGDPVAVEAREELFRIVAPMQGQSGNGSR
jgi:hypothetical protein